MKNKHLVIWAAASLFFLPSAAQNVPQLQPDNLDAVIEAMTPEEKVHLCIGTGMDAFSGHAPVVGSTRSLLPGTAGTTYPIPRLGIPAVALSDGPAGLRIDPVRPFDSKTYYCTHFPIGTALASSWNTSLVEQVGRAIGQEVLEYGSDVLLAPALNIHRHPLCGRNFEYYSEDPVVAGEIAKAYILGVQSQGVGTSIKHFAVNNQETNRNNNDARVSPRSLREIYLKGFEIVIKGARPWTVMSSYNRLNGTYTSESEELLTDILRNDWGYQGMVMTDWFGGKDPVAQMIAGNDMLQPGTPQQYEQILAALKNGQLDEAVIDRNVRRILEMIVKTPHFRKYAYTNRPDLEQHAAITRTSATEGMVLLKNNGALPLAASVRKVAVYGSTSYDIIPGGTGSGNVNRAYTVSLIEGLRNNGYTVDENILNRYLQQINEAKKNGHREGSFNLLAMSAPERLVELVPDPEQLARETVANDAALITIGRISGEFKDRNRNDFYLTDEERALLTNVCQAYHQAGKQVTVVLNIGGVIETASWNSQPDAILCAWQAGQEGGNSIADVLSGRQYPSGKLPMTFPIEVTDAASSANFPLDAPHIDFMQEQTDQNRKDIDYTNYEEDIYVGYRYFDTFDKAVSYPFGYGLSYTTFEYGTPKLTQNTDSCTLTVDITNTGSRPGKEIVELYVKAPAGKLSKPAQELKAFAKTRELKPGEQQTVTLQVAIADLASFDERNSCWTVEKGRYEFRVGASSRDIRETVVTSLKAQKRHVSNVLKPAFRINKLK